jgi:hypothetical protein
MTSVFYQDLLRQVYEHAESNKDKKDDDKLDLLILVENYDRLGRDEHNISLVIATILKIDPNVQFWSIIQFGMSWVEGKRHIYESKLKFREVYDNSRSSIAALLASKEDIETRASIMEEVGEIVRNRRVRTSDELFNSDNITTDEQKKITNYARQLYACGMDIEIENLGTVREIVYHMMMGHLTADGALRAIHQLPFKKSSSSRYVIEYYRTSRARSQEHLTLLKVGDLPFEQFIYILAMKRVLQKQTGGDQDNIYEVGSRIAIFDDRCLRTRYGMGLLKIVTLIAAGRVERVIVKKGNRLPVRMMPLFLALCHIHSVEIVSVEEYGKMFADVTLVELHRQNANKTLTDDMNEAILASSKTWNEKTLEMNKSLGKTLVSLGLGWKQRGKQRAKRRNLPSST